MVTALSPIGRRAAAAMPTVALLAVLVTGCSLLPASGEPSATGSPTPADVRGPADRDPAAVLPALRRIEPCALLDADLARSRGNPDTTAVPTGPHSCSLIPESLANYAPSTSLEGIQLAVGVSFDRAARFSSAPLDLAGTKAYQLVDTIIQNRCTVAIPVSQTLAVRLAYDSPRKDACQALRGYAEFAARRLRAPDTIPVAERRYAHWDGCYLLADALGTDAGRYRYEPDGVDDPFAGCGTSTTDGRGGSAPAPALEVAYDETPQPTEGQHTGGRSVRVKSSPGQCQLTWSPSGSGVANPWVAAVQFALSAPDCDAATRLAQQVMALAEQEPPASAVGPQRPLVYGAADNDTDAVGACVDLSGLGSGGSCAPASSAVTIPNSRAEVLNAPPDPDLWCALFGDAVRARMGTDLKPVVWGNGNFCEFVQPSHTTSVQVGVYTQFTPDSLGTDPERTVDRHTISVAGRPAVAYQSDDRDEYDVWASPHGDITRAGTVHLHLVRSPARGTEVIDSSAGPAVDRRLQAAADAVVADVLVRYFG